MIWQYTDKADPQARILADRHYTRQKVGNPKFVPPGRALVLKTFGAYWVTSWPYAKYVMHRWAGAWVCSAFRREMPCQERASDLIRDAVAATRWYRSNGDNYNWWREEEPRLHNDKHSCDILMVTFVDPAKVRYKRDPGRCFLRAGFLPDGTTADGSLLAFVLPVEAAPEPAAYLPAGFMAKTLKTMFEQYSGVLTGG